MHDIVIKKYRKQFNILKKEKSKMLNSRHTPFLFSVGTELSYRIAKMYYDNVQYVWCTNFFDSKHQPPTSNPMTIAQRYIEQIVNTDRHADEINANIVGILKGARSKLDSGVINKAQCREIGQLVNFATYDAFLPVLYIIDTKKVLRKCKEVDIKDRACDNSVEYVIDNLLENEYELIHLGDLIKNVTAIPDKKVGE